MLLLFRVADQISATRSIADSRGYTLNTEGGFHLDIGVPNTLNPATQRTEVLTHLAALIGTSKYTKPNVRVRLMSQD